MFLLQVVVVGKFTGKVTNRKSTTLIIKDKIKKIVNLVNCKTLLKCMNSNFVYFSSTLSRMAASKFIEKLRPNKNKLRYLKLYGRTGTTKFYVFKFLAERVGIWKWLKKLTRTL